MMKYLPNPLPKLRHKLPALLRVARDLAVVRYEPKVQAAVLPYLNPIDAVCEEPPPRIMWSTHYILLGMFLMLLLWAAVARIDVVVTGGGSLTTAIPPMVLQPMDRGIVREIRVRPGEAVHKGEVLALLDPTFARADLATLAVQARSAETQIKRLEAELADRPMAVADRSSPEEELQQSLYRQRQDQYNSRLRFFDEEIKRLNANLRTTEDDRQSLAKQLDYARELESMRGSLYNSQVGSKLTYLDAKTVLVRTERDYQDTVNRLTEEQHSLQSKQAERQNFIDEWHRQATESLVTARAEADRLHEALAKASLMNDLVSVAAPADGVVLDVAKRSVGSVVNAAEPLFTIVPTDAPLVADITIASSDVGYIKQGDEVIVKVGAFPYQRHGWLNGRLDFISEESYGMRDAGGEPANSGHSSGAVHRGRILFESTELKNLPEGARLIPGMTVDAEIKVGRRSVLSFFLNPLTRGLRESLREP